MTAIAEPPVTAGEPGSARLTPAEGLELLGDLHGSGYKNGAALVRRADGQMVQVGPLMFTLLECLDGRRGPAELAAAMSERLGRQVAEQHIEPLAQKLAEQGLLAGTEDKAPPKSNPLLALRWKVLVTNPRVTQRITAPFTGLFRPWIVWPTLAAFAAVVWFVLIHKGFAAPTAEAFQNPELLLLVFVLAVGSAGFHELGHAAACRYGGGTPGGMGAGIYMVWPAFYTDVTDSYRLPKRDRLRVDLGGLYFNTVVAVATLAVWLAVHVDALLLLVALQLLQMVKQLSPVIRADGYHILSDLTGVPDLYAHMVPTLKRLLPGHKREPSALTGRARLLVTAWVLIIVPVLLALAASAVLLMPRLMATAWASGQNIATGIPGDVEHARVLDVLASVLRLFALVLPVLGAVLMASKIVRTAVEKAGAWSDGRPRRRAALTLATAGLMCVLAWVWWPSGQYRPVRADERGTLIGATKLLSAPETAARPPAEGVRLTPGKHLAVALIPEGGATKKHPALFVIKGDDGQKPVVVMSPTAPEPTASAASTDSAAPAGTSTSTQPSATGAPVTETVAATAFPFKLPSAPGPHGTQALAVNTKDGSIKYVVAYTLVTVHDGEAVDQTNEAYAFASCNACTTVAVSFQVVLIVGTSDLIAPINVAGALNVNCPACITTAIANQIVITLDAEPSEELLAKLTDELQQLDALSALGADGSPEEIARQVDEVEQQIHEELENSGLTSDSSNEPAPTQTSTTPPTTTETSTTPTETSTTPTETSTTPTETSTTPTETSTTPTDTTTTPTETSTTPTETSTTPTTTTETTTEPSSTDTTTTPSG
jgi:putative peptide zinc metalloprotease protein